tara:strand:+ start:4754 stop:5248 length:495 start_codon:yes stop_codon:yes gene_type:complete
MPQLNPEFFISQLFWLLITFSFLLFFLWKISLPRIGKVLEKRQAKINNDLIEAKELQKEAEKIQVQIDEQLRNAKDSSSQLVKQSFLKLQESANNELKNIDKELGKKIKDSSNTIEKNKNESLININSQIEDIAKIILSKVSDFNISNDDIKKAVSEIETRKIN